MNNLGSIYFYLTSLAHCYPGKAAGSGDRPPPKCCYQKWLNQEMKLVNNEIYIIVGSYSAKLFFLIKVNGFSF